MPDFGSNLSIVALLAAGGAVTAFWGQIKAFFERMITYAVVTAKIDDRELARAVGAHCFCHLRRSPIGVKTFRSISSYVRPISRRENIGCEQIGESSMLFWDGWRPIWVSLSGNVMTLRFIRFTFNADKIVVRAVDNMNELNRVNNGITKRFVVKYVIGRDTKEAGRSGGDYDGINMKHLRMLKWKHEEIGSPKSLLDPIDQLSLNEEALGIIEETRFWKKSEEWYRKRGIPWKRGYLFHGKPGTGKTSLARAIAEDLDLPVFVFDLASLTNEDMRAQWTNVLQTTPCMVVFEDIDSVFEGRKNIACENKMVKPPLTFDCLLNCIDGIERSDGILLVITTNNVEKLDAAIGGCQKGTTVSRPGRIDRVLHCACPDKKGLIKIAKRIMSHADERIFNEVIRLGEDNKDTVVQFQERCFVVALNLRWGKPVMQILAKQRDEIERRKIEDALPKPVEPAPAPTPVLKETPKVLEPIPEDNEGASPRSISYAFESPRAPD